MNSSLSAWIFLLSSSLNCCNFSSNFLSLSANQKNQELQEHIEKLNDKLENQEAESERKLEEKLQQFKEEESRKIQALRDEFMAALHENTQTTLAQVKDI